MEKALQYSCLENPMDGGAWWAAVHEVAKSQTWLSDFTFTFHFHALEKELATHSSVLAWRIPGTGEPGGLPSMGSHRVGHDWSDLAAAASYRAFSLHNYHKGSVNYKSFLLFKVDTVIRYPVCIPMTCPISFSYGNFFDNQYLHQIPFNSSWRSREKGSHKRSLLNCGNNWSIITY